MASQTENPEQMFDDLNETNQYQFGQVEQISTPYLHFPRHNQQFDLGIEFFSFLRRDKKISGFFAYGYENLIILCAILIPT